MMKLKSVISYLINGSLGKVGLQLRRLPRSISEEHQAPPEPELPKVEPFDPSPFIWLSAMKIKTILDIGANTGQFSTEIRKILPIAKIIAFEPLKDCYEELVKKGESLRYFEAHNFALGDKEDKVKIHRSEFAPSSSILPMGDLHKEIFPHTKKTFYEEVEIRRLDDLKLELPRPLLVKMDVQGLEDKVIDGGETTISQADVIMTEVSYARLYENQALFDDIYRRLYKLGFIFHGTTFQDINPRDGSAVQADAIFIKEAK
jgi:FkbM family methyltransferase